MYLFPQIHSLITLRTTSSEEPVRTEGHRLSPRATQSHCAPTLIQTSQGVGREKGRDWQVINCHLPDFTALGANQLLRSVNLLKHKLILVSGHSPSVRRAHQRLRGHRAGLGVPAHPGLGGPIPNPPPGALLAPGRCKSGTAGDTGREGRALQTLLQSEGKAGWMEQESRDRAGKWGEREKYCQQHPKCLEI